MGQMGRSRQLGLGLLGGGSVARLRHALFRARGGESRAAERRSHTLPVSAGGSRRGNEWRRDRPVSIAGRNHHRCKFPEGLIARASSRLAAATDGHPVQWARLAALGVVFGDLGTSPLYTLQTVVQAVGGRFTPASAIGILSLIVWTLIITVSIKYCLFVMRADNRGEGGTLALMSLIGANGFTRGFTLLTGMGLLGAALIYGDGVITPAISVLSALEGVNVATETLKPFVMPMAVLILIVLFTTQRFGTERIGRAFGPIMLLWFIIIALLGVVAIAHHPAV